jgi:hypothetical protein
MLRVLSVLAVLAFAVPAQARKVTLAFDAVYTHAQVVDNAPAGDSVGDRQVAGGDLRDVTGKKVGTSTAPGPAAPVTGASASLARHVRATSTTRGRSRAQPALCAGHMAVAWSTTRQRTTQS